MTSILFALIAVIILIFSAILHEVAHGYVADRLGDPTARLLGRLTLNPAKHIDPVMSIFLPFILILSGSPVIFGAAKPVPIDPFNLKEGRKDIAMVSLAGPITNILIAIIFSIICRIIFPGLSLFEITNSTILGSILGNVVYINLLLAIFNLIPIPPLDGSKVFSLFLPEDMANTYLSLSSIGFFIIFFLLLFPIGGFSLGQLIFTLLTFAEKLLGL
jgi:Zn-dependent protease